VHNGSNNLPEDLSMGGKEEGEGGSRHQRASIEH
jgi:hypothetical protein